MGLRGGEERGDQKYVGAAKLVERRTWNRKGPKTSAFSWRMTASPKTFKQRVLGIRQVQVQNPVFIPSGPHLRIKENLFYSISGGGVCKDNVTVPGTG